MGADSVVPQGSRYRAGDVLVDTHGSCWIVYDEEQSVISEARANFMPEEFVLYARSHPVSEAWVKLPPTTAEAVGEALRDLEMRRARDEDAPVADMLALHESALRSLLREAGYENT